MKKISKAKKILTANQKISKFTWTIGVLGIIFYLTTFFLGFFIGLKWQEAKAKEIISYGENIVSAVVFKCDSNKFIYAEFLNNEVSLKLSDKRSIILPKAISGSGARYATSDESLIFWNKGNGAFIEESGKTTYENCVTPN